MVKQGRRQSRSKAANQLETQHLAACRRCKTFSSLAAACVNLTELSRRAPKDHLTPMPFLRTMWRFLLSLQLLPALESGEETLVGGQAVLEGVMTRSPHAWAIACRKPSGDVVTHSE